MKILLNLVKDLRMVIDFSKSWAWATSKQFKEFWVQASALLMQPSFTFQIKNNVHDLGCMIHYSNTMVLGPVRDKMDNAGAKCNRLRKLNLDLDERAEKNGTFGQVIGDKHFKALRRAAANVLVGDHKHASSFVALHYLSRRIQDPLLYVITDLLTTLRRFFVYHAERAELFVQEVCAFQSQVKGPATALASYLKKLGWEMTPKATVLGPGGLRLNVKTNSNKQIKQQLHIAWGKPMPA